MTSSAVASTRKIWPLVSVITVSGVASICSIKVRVEHNGGVIQSSKPDQETYSVNLGGFGEFITGAARAHQLLRRPALKILQKTGKTLGFIGVAAEAPTVVGRGEFSNSGAESGLGQ